MAIARHRAENWRIATPAGKFCGVGIALGQAAVRRQFRALDQFPFMLPLVRQGNSFRDRMMQPEAIVSAGRQPERPSRNLMLLPSELTTVALVLWAAARLYGSGSITVPLAIESLILWCLVSVAAAQPWRDRLEQPAPSGGFSPVATVFVRGVGLGALVVLARIQCPALDWKRAAAIGVMLGAVLSVVRWLLCWASGGGGLRRSDGWRGAGLQAVAAYALQPYVVGAQVGSGDAYHYSISLSDALEQLRAGVFPLFVGQTAYAFNGNVHPIRTAPLYEYLGGAIDFMTLHTLPIFGLQNLILFLAAGLAALGGYAAMRRYAPGRAWEAAGLAALYVLCPGVLAPLYEGDMVATFLTVPVIPWLILGLAKATDGPEAWAPWLLQATALAVLWWAHPPVAFWASLLALGAWALILLRVRWTWLLFLRMAAASLLFALLAAYVFESVHSLHLRESVVPGAQAITPVMASISGYWRQSLMPISGDSLLGDVQLGYALAACASAGCLAIRSRRSAAMLLLGIATFFILLVPVPGVTARLWSLAPGSVFQVTNSWPMQRFYVILAGLAAFSALAGASWASRERRIERAVLGTCIVLGLCWSSAEAHKLIVGALRATSTRDASERSHRVENVVLTRSSYAIFNSFPTYFSDGVMTPLLATRLIAARTLELVGDGSTPVPGQPAAQSAAFALTRTGGDTLLSPTLLLEPRGTSIIRFDFLGQQPGGDLLMTSPTLRRDYALPSSGQEESFGAGPANGRAIAINNDGDSPETVTLFYYPRPIAPMPAGPFARATVERLDAVDRMIRLRSLLPFVVDVRSDRPAVLETPKVFIPGYCATVNGLPAFAEETAEGMLGVRVPAGTSQVRVVYTGGYWLRFAFWASSAGFCCVMVGASAAPLFEVGSRSRRLAAAAEDWLLAGMRRWGITFMALTVLALAGLWLRHRFMGPPSGPVRLVLMVPVVVKPGLAEPLLTTGRTGAADIIYLNYVGGCQFTVGHDKWGYGGTVSNPFKVDPTQPQTVEIAMKSLGNGRGVHVVWNGSEVLGDSSDSYAQDPGTETEIGSNMIGATTCGTIYTGRILESGREDSIQGASPKAATTP